MTHRFGRAWNAFWGAVFREGHDALNADVVLTDPSGVRRPWVRMTKDPEEPDLWSAALPLPALVGTAAEPGAATTFLVSTTCLNTLLLASSRS